MKKVSAKAPNESGLPAPKTPASVRHASYPVDTPEFKAPRITAQKGASTRSYGKAPPPPPNLDSPFGGF